MTLKEFTAALVKAQTNRGKVWIEAVYNDRRIAGLFTSTYYPSSEMHATLIPKHGREEISIPISAVLTVTRLEESAIQK